MARKLRIYQTSLGFFEQAIAVRHVAFWPAHTLATIHVTPDNLRPEIHDLV